MPHVFDIERGCVIVDGYMIEARQINDELVYIPQGARIWRDYDECTPTNREHVIDIQRDTKVTYYVYVTKSQQIIAIPGYARIEVCKKVAILKNKVQAEFETIAVEGSLLAPNKCAIRPGANIVIGNLEGQRGAISNNIIVEAGQSYIVWLTVKNPRVYTILEVEAAAPLERRPWYRHLLDSLA